MQEELSHSNIVAIASESEILGNLRQPEIMAVIWPKAWSDSSLAFANFLSKNDQLSRPGNTDILHDVVSSFPDSDGASSFKADLRHFERLFRMLGMHLHFGAVLNDRSRLESTDYNGLNIVPNWHVDSGHLALLSVPSGPTTEYIDGHVTGRFNDIIFQPADIAASQIKSLQNDDVIIFKCRPFAQDESTPSFIHKRPHSTDLAAVHPNRPVVHMKLS